MGIRLFVPPGSGQFFLIPERPESIGANATLQYTVIGSTALAATYTALASSYRQRVTPLRPISNSALFIRSSAKLGLCVGALGAAVNYYYYSAFVESCLAERNVKRPPWKLYEWTTSRTLEDACLAGATIGLVASAPFLFRRRPTIPRWTRSVGMANIGACVGILGAHGYFQYIGERQPAYEYFDESQRRRLQDLSMISRDKPLMARFDPLIQQYIRHHGLWYTNQLPKEKIREPEPEIEHSPGCENAPGAQEQPFYGKPTDYAQDLKQIDYAYTTATIKQLEAEKQALLKEADFLLLLNAQKEYDYCRNKNLTPAERSHRLHEIFINEIVYNKTRSAASSIDISLAKWRVSLQHKALTDAHPTADEPPESWLPKSVDIDQASHDPAIAIRELEGIQSQIVRELRDFDVLIQSKAYEPERKERWRLDVEDGRALLRATDAVLLELGKVQARVKVRGEGGGKREPVRVPPPQTRHQNLNPPHLSHDAATTRCPSAYIYTYAYTEITFGPLAITGLQ
ncbi:hypothetical protein GQ44DRAFT_753005 [Phaeosphaeriaceae sp. PMI808]|nr:hypothetical protein GQ44DRAFT_753005 [Phaeosphaeriaceae sp. PMI808]